MKYTIVTKFIKDISFEIPDAETLMILEENINKYVMKVDITSKHLKNKIIEVDTILRFEDTQESKRKAQVELTMATLVNIGIDLNDKKELQKIILIDVPTEIYPSWFDVFSTLLEKSGLRKLKVEKKKDFQKLYDENFNVKT